MISKCSDLCGSVHCVVVFMLDFKANSLLCVIAALREMFRGTHITQPHVRKTTQVLTACNRHIFKNSRSTNNVLHDKHDQTDKSCYCKISDVDNVMCN